MVKKKKKKKNPQMTFHHNSHVKSGLYTPLLESIINSVVHDIALP